MPAKQGVGKGKRGSRKIGRDKKKCEKYRLAGRREKNKAQREAKRQAKFAKRKAKRERRGE